ncbi:unnamed protein product, partial [Cylicocyclus nassatus]
ILLRPRVDLRPGPRRLWSFSSARLRLPVACYLVTLNAMHWAFRFGQWNVISISPQQLRQTIMVTMGFKEFRKCMRIGLQYLCVSPVTLPIKD